MKFLDPVDCDLRTNANHVFNCTSLYTRKTCLISFVHNIVFHSSCGWCKSGPCFKRNGSSSRCASERQLKSKGIVGYETCTNTKEHGKSD